jgi:type IX secretion system PorP/SprF family membrane protein
MTLKLINRSQWVGIQGAPKTLVMVLSTPLGSSNVGMGVSVIRDEIGPAVETNTTLDVSYLLKLNNNDLFLSFGMKGGIQFLDVDYSKLLTQTPDDVSLNDNINSRKTPTIGAGFFLYNKNWYLGFSSPNLLSTKHYNKVRVSTVSSEAHFYLTGGINFDFSETLKFKPAFLFKHVEGSPLALDLSLNILFNNRFRTGVSFRNNSSISAMVNFKVNSFLSIGYAYDYDTSDISYFSNGSHEVLLTLSFNRLLSNFKTPRWSY